MALTSISKELPFAVEVADIFVYPPGQGSDNLTFEVQFRDPDGQLYSLSLDEAVIRRIQDAHKKSFAIGK